jgi:two-component system alkaline phosphatase synthesis response regulator PhoP
VDLESFEAHTKSGETSRLTAKEAQLLRYFFAQSGRVVSRNDLLDNVWGRDAYPTPRTIDNFIARFRKLFEEDPRHPQHFITLRASATASSPERRHLIVGDLR